MNADLQQQFVSDLLAESTEGLDRFEQLVLLIEGGTADSGVLNEIFRVVHTLKGTAGCLGFNRIQRLSHVGENLLDQLRSGHLAPSGPIGAALLRLSDALRTMLRDVESTGADGNNDFPALAQELQDLRDGRTPAAPAAASVKTAAVPSPAAEPPAPAVEPNATWGLFDDEPAAPAPAPSETIAADSSWGLFDEAPAAPAASPAPVAAAAVPPAAETPAPRDASGPAAANATVRVDVALLDRLMNLVGELVLTRNQLLQASQNRGTGLGEVSQRLNLITSELQENVMKTRMQPIGNVWGKFPRIVRDIAHEIGKQVRLETFGAETELDRTIIEAIRDPLTHVIRNSVDHGIESPEARVAAGKPPVGSIIMRAYHEGGQVIIDIVDDGQGVNVARVRARALERGLITADEAARFSEAEFVNLIFQPGFSTAEKVTNMSGRGVGMDVVKTNIEKIGGSVELLSAAGQGTTLKIKIPLTLAIIPALLVRAGGRRYAIPQVNLLELVRLDGDAAKAALEQVYDSPVFRLRGSLLPLVFLERELKLPTSPSANNSLCIVVLQAEKRRFGLVVSDVCDTEEIVVKPLSQQLKGLPMFAGATIMGDGRVALILDVLGLAEHARVLSEARTTVPPDHGATSTDQAAATQFIIFSVCGRERLALPLEKAARLEEIETAKLERSGTREAVQYRGSILPLVRLDRILPGARPSPDRESLQVIVYQHGGRSVGLIVNEIRDIVEDHLEIQEGTASPGITGSAVVQGAITDVVDIPAILRAADRAA